MIIWFILDNNFKINTLFVENELLCSYEEIFNIYVVGYNFPVAVYWLRQGQYCVG